MGGNVVLEATVCLLVLRWNGRQYCNAAIAKDKYMNHDATHE
jgi:hypothetical protein